MRKVAIIYARFGPYHIARLEGTNRVLNPLGWAAIGIEVCPDDQFYAWSKVSDANDTHRVALFPGRLYKELDRSEIYAALENALDRENPDAVACPGWFYAEALAGAKWARRRGKKAILMSESGYQDDARIWWKEFFKRLNVRRFDSALVGGEAHADYLIRLGFRADKIAVGHNVVDNSYFAVGAEAARGNASLLRKHHQLPDHYFLASGRFVAKKNFGQLLDAYAMYRNARCDAAWSLVLCGDGPLREKLQAQAREISVDDHVFWPGFIQYEQLPVYYGLAEAFILPSTIEPWGLVVNEAMSCGLPVLASRTAGCHFNLVEEGCNGYVFDPFLVEDMASTLDRFAALSASHRAAMGRRSQTIITDWGPQRFGEGLKIAIHHAGLL